MSSIGDARSTDALGNGEGADAETDVLALAIEQEDWQRTALLLLLGVSLAAQSLPAGTIEDVLALLSIEEGA